uniref:Uncharacterized protein n=1 Tax=Parascaris equorum TaxID=6256 RepID=A0A914S757_PAREQ
MLVLKRLGISGGTSAGVNLMVSLHLAATRRFMHTYRTADTRMVVTCYVRALMHLLRRMR